MPDYIWGPQCSGMGMKDMAYSHAVGGRRPGIVLSFLLPRLFRQVLHRPEPVSSLVKWAGDPTIFRCRDPREG